MKISFKKKSIQNRLFISYSILFITVLVILTILLYFSFQILLRESTDEVLLQNATNVNNNFDAVVEKMDGMLKQVVFSDTINDEFFKKPKSGKSIFLPLESRRKICNEMYAILGPNFSDVEKMELIDTDSGNYLSVGTTKLETVVSHRSLDNAQWITDVLHRNGLLTIVSPHKDAFSSNAETSIICIARAYRSREALRYSAVVYIPYRVSLLETVLVKAKDANKYIKDIYLYDTEYNLICGTGENYVFPEPLSRDTKSLQNSSVQEDGELVLLQTSTATGWTVLIKADKTMMSTPTKTTYFILLGTLFSAMVAVLIMSLALSKHFTVPISKIYKDMKNVSLIRADSGQIIRDEDEGGDELETLYNTFHRLCDRLDSAIEESALARYAENEAKVAAMEAEINPHFLYNTFALIRNYGDAAHVPEVSEICDNLSALLRYAVSENNEVPTIGSELDSCLLYLNIMHIRNYDRLSYNVDVDDAILHSYMPRMILQPIVENCFLHGLMPKDDLWMITIKGYAEDDSWYIEITDNGVGFPESVLDALLSNQNQLKHDELKRHKRIGLNNIITRLRYRFGSDLIFQISNREEGGSCVKIGVRGGMNIE